MALKGTTNQKSPNSQNEIFLSLFRRAGSKLHESHKDDYVIAKFVT